MVKRLIGSTQLAIYVCVFSGYFFLELLKKGSIIDIMWCMREANATLSRGEEGIFVR